MCVVEGELVVLCCRLDMTQEQLDCLDAALKMSDTGASAGVIFMSRHFVKSGDPHVALSFGDRLKSCVRWTPTGSSLPLQRDIAG